MASKDLTFKLFGQDVSASKVLQGAGKEADTSGKKFQGMGKLAGTALGLISGAGLVEFGKSSVGAFTDAQASQAKLADAFKRFPALANTNQAALQALNSELEKKTGYDDDDAAAAQAQLAQFKLNGQQVAALTPLLQDYAAKTGKSLPEAATDLGKAMLGQGKALKAIGINFKDTGTAGGNFAELMGGLRTQVGGFAEGQGKTAAGQTKILKAEFGELEETVGSKLVPVLTKLLSWGLKIVAWIQQNITWLGPLVGALAAVAVVVFLVVKAIQLWTVVQEALNVVMSLNPIGLVVLAIVALVAIFVLAYKKVGWFRAGVDAAFSGIKIAIGWISGAIGAVIGFIKSNFGKVFEILSTPFKLWWAVVRAEIGLVVAAFKTVVSVIGPIIGKVKDVLIWPFKTAFNAIADLWNNTVGRISFSLPSWIPGIGGKGFSMPKIPHLADGGVVFARVGERGPETVALPSGAAVFPHGKGPAGAGGDLHVVLMLDSEVLARGMVTGVNRQATRGTKHTLQVKIA